MDDKKKSSEESTIVDFTEDSTIDDEKVVRKQKIHIIGLTLVVLDGMDKGEEYPITHNRMTIGRKGTDVILADPKISRKHAEIEVLGRGYYFIKDLASSNGTFVNEVLITNQRINPFDKIRLGNTVLTVIEK